MDDSVTIKLALQIAGGILTIIAGFSAWIYTQFIAKNVNRVEQRLERLSADHTNRIAALELERAQRAGTDLPDRLSRLEVQVSSVDKEVAVLKASEAERNTRLAQGLAELERLEEQLRGDINIGDLESRISSAQALVRTLQVAVTLAKLQPSEAQERAQAELRLAEATLLELMKQRER
jgi:hypothetical protein